MSHIVILESIHPISKLLVQSAYFERASSFAWTVFMEKFWSYIRICHVCKKYEFQSTSLLCESCKTQLLHQSDLSQKELHLDLGFTVYTWCHWTEDNDSLLRPTIYALKGGYLKQAIYELCTEASLHISETFQAQPILLPAPSKNKNQKDHAYIIAESLAEIFNLKIINAFERVNTSALQKSKSKSQRKLPNLKLNSDLTLTERKSLFKPENNFLFVDDIVTTGSTAKHAFKSVNKHYKFSSFSLFYRPLKFNED